MTIWSIASDTTKFEAYCGFATSLCAQSNLLRLGAVYFCETAHDFFRVTDIFDVIKLPTPDILNQLSREELLAFVLVLIDDVQTLRAEVDRLESPPPTSHNSSQPPSQDWKANTPETGEAAGRETGARQNGTALGGHLRSSA
jgi:hypothetical protein